MLTNTVRIEEFNAMPEPEARDLVRPCVAIPSFADAVAAGRPYAGLDALLAAARAHADAWTEAEVLAALADHPRIGERHREAGRSAELSSREQAGVSADADLQDRLREGNARYEERFGRIYLVRAAGRSGEELLALLEQRLGNDPATELRVTTEQLGEIALLRLEGLLTA